MQKRRGGGGNGGSGLPLTAQDTATTTAAATTTRRRRRKNHRRDTFLCDTTFAGIGIVAVMLILSVFVMKMLLDPKDAGTDNGASTGGGNDGSAESRKKWGLAQKPRHMEKKMKNRARDTNNNSGGVGGVAKKEGFFTLPLSKFTTLKYALDNADIVALYFAAAWCPMSTPITKSLDVAFSGKDILLPPPPDSEEEEEEEKIHKKDKRRSTLAIVYVSSDASETQMSSYIKPEWNAIPYESSERDALKKHFSTCAKKEMEDLGISIRKHEIPTIVLVNSLTHGVLSTHGVDDVKKIMQGYEGEGDAGKVLLDQWVEVQNIARVMEDKFMV